METKINISRVEGVLDGVKLAGYNVSYVLDAPDGSRTGRDYVAASTKIKDVEDLGEAIIAMYAPAA